MRTAYADESGDTGYKPGASPLFALAVLMPLDPEALMNRVIEARRRLGKPETFEFHFRQANEKILLTFFEAVTGERLNLLVAAIHKAGVPEEVRREGKTGLYIHGLSGLALRSQIALSDVKLHLDGTGSQKIFVQALKNGVRLACRKAGRRDQNFKEIRILSSTHPLIQCADMFAGAAYERVETRKSKWFAMIKPEKLIWWEEKFDKKTKPL